VNLSFRRTWPLFLDTTASLGTFPLIAHSMIGYGRLKETIRVRERENQGCKLVQGGLPRGRQAETLTRVRIETDRSKQWIDTLLILY